MKGDIALMETDTLIHKCSCRVDSIEDVLAIPGRCGPYAALKLNSGAGNCDSREAMQKNFIAMPTVEKHTFQV